MGREVYMKARDSVGLQGSSVSGRGSGTESGAVWCHHAWALWGRPNPRGPLLGSPHGLQRTTVLELMSWSACHHGARPERTPRGCSPVFWQLGALRYGGTFYAFLLTLLWRLSLLVFLCLPRLSSKGQRRTFRIFQSSHFWQHRGQENKCWWCSSKASSTVSQESVWDLVSWEYIISPSLSYSLLFHSGAPSSRGAFPVAPTLPQRALSCHNPLCFGR